MENERYDYISEYPQIYDFPGKSKSTVWKDFGFYKSPETGFLDKSSAVCKICLALVKYCGNTTNLHTHLTKHRPKQYADMRTIKFDEVIITNVADGSFNQDGIIGNSRSPPTCSETVTGTITCGVSPTASYPTVQNILMNSKHAQALNNSLVEYLISNLLPPSMVDNTAFRNMLRTADQGYNMPPSRYFMETLIPQYYNETKANIQKYVQNTENVTISTDIWTSNITESEFITFSVHLIDPIWEPHTFTLCTLEIEDDADRMSSALQNVLHVWGIPGTPILVTNSDVRLKSATGILRLPNISCLGNAIGMAASDILASDGVPCVIENCRRFIKALNRNGRDKSKFRRMQQEMNDDLELDNAAKWTTTFDMLLKICRKCDTIVSVPQQDCFSKETRQSVPHPEQLEKAKTIKNVLKPLRTAAKLISDQGPSTASMILPVLRKLEITLAVKEEDQCYSTALKRRIVDVLSPLYQDSSVRDCLLVASVLDPRYKDLLFVDPAERKRGKEQLADEATVLYRISKGDTRVDLVTPGIKLEPDLEIINTYSINGSIASASSDLSPAKRPRMEPEVTDDDDWLADVVSMKPETKTTKSSLEESVLAEIDRYASTEQTTTAPLQWWKNREAMYPILSRLVKRYLCITATNDQYDRAISTDVQQKAWSYQRAMLPADFVDKMLFLNKNYFKF